MSRSTVSREIRRNRVGGMYSPHHAELLAESRQRTSHVHKTYGREAWETVDAMLREDLSPEQVAGRLRLEGCQAPSAESIYQHIWQDKARSGDLYEHLRRKNRKHHKRGNLYKSRGRIANRRDICERPVEAERRSRFGDLEIDTVIGKDRKGALLTMNDRAAGIAWVRKLDGRDSDELARVAIKALRPLKKRGLLHTITSDNGLEFARHEKIARAMDVDFFFARPYRSNDRASNENMNGLIRQYVPKGTCMENVTDRDAAEIERKLNTRPRKRFDFKSPEEYLLEKFNLVLH